MSSRYPALPLPGPLMGSEIGTFAHNTVVVRLPDIARRAIQENTFTPGQVRAVQALIDDIPGQPIRRLFDGDAPDAAWWERAAAPFLGKTWLNVPWFFAETYFYRRMIEATGYYTAGAGSLQDPYTYQKLKGLEATRADAARLLRQVDHLLSGDFNPGSAVERLLLVNLWANQVDLSLWPVDQAERPDHADPVDASGFILVDERERVAKHLLNLAAEKPRQVDFLVDNAGFELVCDLALAYALLRLNCCDKIQFHLKLHPTFVSDATISDALYTLRSLSEADDQAEARVGQSLLADLARGRLVLKDHLFWTSPYAMWEMPEDLYDELSTSGMVIVKGDANYRRLLGDRHWQETDPFTAILSYFPAPLAALRTLKSDPLVGLAAGQADTAAQKDLRWRTDGRWGIIQTTLK